MKQKNIVYSALFLAAVFFSGCSMPIEPPSAAAGQETLPPGTGSVQILLDGEGQGSRTLLPAGIPDTDYVKYDLKFTRSSGDPVTVDDWDKVSPVILPAGSWNWNLNISAYISDGADGFLEAARGGTESSFTVTHGATSPVSVTMYPLIEEGTGTFAWDISYPDEALRVSMTVQPLPSGTAETVYLKTDGGEQISENPGSKSLAAGYYRVTTFLSDGARSKSRTDVMHIYKERTTTAAFVFPLDYLAPLSVISAADSGPGTLREAIEKAEAGDTILVELPPGSIIPLTSNLAINKSLTIDGNGVTLSGANAGSGILYIGAGPVTLRRIHFKDGKKDQVGGAIHNIGNSLTLESCIFSGNRALGSGSIYGARGGAVYSRNTLIVRACTFYNNTSQYQGGAIYNHLGTATLTGNIFFGNTASDGWSIVYNDTSTDAGNYPQGTTTTSGGYNLNDAPMGTSAAQCGFSYTTGDLTSYDLPVSPVNFKPLADSPAIGKISSIPADYPLSDFYGVPMSAAPLSKGAVQTAITSTGYWLDYAAIGQGTISFAPGSAPYNEDGIYSPGSTVILEATPEPGSGFSFRRWILNGDKQPVQLPPERFSFTMDGNKILRAAFGRSVTVTSLADSGPGTLRDAMANALDYDIINIDTPLSGGTIVLTSALPDISKNMTIEGNGVTLLGSNIQWVSGHFGFVYITDDQPTTFNEVTIRRVHFKDMAADLYYIRAIGSAEDLTFESCIFSGIIAQSASLVLSAEGPLAVRGCTFYNNTSTASGTTRLIGSSSTGGFSLTGNIFYGNNVLRNAYRSGTAPSSGGYNISDKDAANSGWSFAATDKQVNSIPINRLVFKPFAGGDADAQITSIPAEYPAYDFYGNSMSTAPLAIGAVQAAVAQGYYLDSGSLGNGTVAVLSGSPDADGIYGSGSSVTLQATAGGGVVFHYWTVDGIRQPAQSPPNQLGLTMDADKTVRAVFGRNVTVTSTDDSGAGTLREALADEQDYDIISISSLLSGQTIALSSPLPAVTKNITIEGNSVILSGSGIPQGDSSWILSIENIVAEVTIRRVHFKDGKTTGNGGAVSNNGILALESCIFSGNSARYGGAIYNYHSLNVKGCTFYGNNADAGGAILNNTVLMLAGNIFYENTASSYPVVYHYYGGGGVISGGYNVADKTSGTNSGDSGWNFATGDTGGVTVLPFSPKSFKPISGRSAEGVITAIPGEYPAEDFYGTAMTTAPLPTGAVRTLAAAGYYLDYGPLGNGTVSVISGADGDGMCSSGSSVTLQAAPSANGTILHYWSVDGVRQPAQNPASQLTVTVSADTTVRAVFAPGLVVTTATSEALQEAFDTVPSGGVVMIELTAGTTINVPSSSVLNIGNKDIVIEGNGVTLSGGNSSGILLNIYTARTITIRRVHFKNADNGQALQIRANLTVESCIFSGNTKGAIRNGNYNSRPLTIRGCTFYGNTTTGVIYNATTVYLAGNLFYNNAMPDSGNLTSQGYNVSDKPAGSASSGGSGWNFAAGDIQASSLTFNNSTFRPSAGGLSTLQIVPVGTENFPAIDFYGDARAAYTSGGNTAAGAVSH
jgi:hypothetical protein